MAARLPCPQCGTMNYPQDAQCLGCGCRFTPRPPAVPAARAVPQHAPDEMCPRCYGVLLPAAKFDTSGLLGGIDSGGLSLQTGNMAVRETAAALGFLEMVSQILLGSIQAKLFQKRLRRVLQEAPHSLCCPSCQTIVRR